jgi:hypothetical protein
MRRHDPCQWWQLLRIIEFTVVTVRITLGGGGRFAELGGELTLDAVGLDRWPHQLLGGKFETA